MAPEEDQGANVERVLQYVVEHPGCYLRQIRRALQVSMGTAQYHLWRLEKTGKVISTRRGMFRHYFPAGTFREYEKNLLEVLGHETTRAVLLLIIERQNPTQSDIAAEMRLSAPSIGWHTRRLVEARIVTESREGKYKRYQLRGAPQPLVSLMRNYYPSLWATWSDRLAELFLALSRDEPKKE